MKNRLREPVGHYQAENESNTVSNDLRPEKYDSGIAGIPSIVLIF